MPFARSVWRKWQRSVTRKLDPLSEQEFRAVLGEQLGLQSGDVVLIHSSMDYLKCEFPFFRILALLRDVVGTSGTLLFPTYPNISSYEFLTSGAVFDVRKSPSYTGVLSELARRLSQAQRSIHPTKSVCAIGPLARELTADHHKSPYPYSEQSPYGKLAAHGGKIIGIGVTTSNMSFAHCVEDELQDRFPVATYHSQLFQSPCIDDAGNALTVATYAHDLSKMMHNVPKFIHRHIPDTCCEDIEVQGMRFFRAAAPQLLVEMRQLALRGTTIYPQRLYRKMGQAA